MIDIVKIYFIFASFLLCHNFKSYYETHNKETISNEVIESSGLFRLSDILKLSN